MIVYLGGINWVHYQCDTEQEADQLVEQYKDKARVYKEPEGNKWIVGYHI